MTTIRELIQGLNKIQAETGHRGSLRAFRAALLDPDFWSRRGKKAPSFSYEAVRNYHLQREPASSYILAVTERFDVNPAWLLTGEGLLFMEDVRRAQAASLGEADHPLWPPALSGVPELADWPTPAKVLFLDVLWDYALSFEGWVPEVLEKESQERQFQAWEALARDLFGMVNVSYHSFRPVGRREFTHSLVAMIHAVQLRIPGVEEGPHIFYRFPPLDPEWRAMWEEDLSHLPGDEERAQEILNAPLTEVQPSMWSHDKYWKAPE